MGCRCGIIKRDATSIYSCFMFFIATFCRLALSLPSLVVPDWNIYGAARFHFFPPEKLFSFCFVLFTHRCAFSSSPCPILLFIIASEFQNTKSLFYLFAVGSAFFNIFLGRFRQRQEYSHARRGRCLFLSIVRAPRGECERHTKHSSNTHLVLNRGFSVKYEESVKKSHCLAKSINDGWVVINYLIWALRFPRLSPSHRLQLWFVSLVTGASRFSLCLRRFLSLSLPHLASKTD